ncbi:MAG: 4Fe-4S binding protein [Bacteroidales bacterium]|nr:4Fe-4S binding protein [Bacteroidales bacterium]
MALIAIYLLLIGGVFIKMFWCKYICPLGAISNIFKYFITAIIITVLYFLLHLIGWTLPWEWLLIIFCITGYLNEIFHNRPKIFPLFKITRDTTKCTGCGDCMKKCPYNIPVHLTRTVKNVDCTLCGDCISECKSAALSINKKKNIKWIIPIITILFFATGILIGNKWEIPVINYTWGNRDTIKTKILEIDGLRSVSCYYAAINFSKKIRKIKGTYGIKAYTRNKRVIITYNPDETAPEIIRKSLYRPVKLKIFKPDKSVRRIKVLTLHTANMEDPLDVSYLGLQFRTIKRKYYALSSEYSNPLTLKLYIDINEPIDLDFIKNIVETPELSIPLRGGRIRKIKMGFKFLYLENKIDTISKRSMLELMFRPYKKIFKKDLDQKDLETYEIIYPNIEKPILRRYLPYLANYLSQNKWIWGIETTLNNDCSSVIRIYYSRTHFNKQAIQNMLTHEKWRIKINDSTFKEIHAALPFHFKEKHK